MFGYLDNFKTINDFCSISLEKFSLPLTTNDIVARDKDREDGGIPKTGIGCVSCCVLVEWKIRVRCPCKNQFHGPRLDEYGKYKKVRNRRQHDNNDSDRVRANDIAKHDWH